MSAIRLSGALARDGRHFTGTDGAAYLEVAVSQTACAVDVIARRPFGTGHAAQYAAQRAAAHLKRGAHVTVYAAGFAIDRRARQLLLQGVDHIEHHTDRPAIAGAQPERETA